ncbi:glycogen(starch) synthase [Puccinia graminis f. sp. tritici]|uniref:Glycogen(Starch) synthase n=1 Tax=Puccinia graminis f. sp. tritici TaxID=56615 RepID=A0A5B0MWX9_PUCGR|nr:glycogen(starch) synthase [Puccinia graminis f. sp. tritici]
MMYHYMSSHEHYHPTTLAVTSVCSLVGKGSTLSQGREGFLSACLETLQSQGREGFLSASRLYSLKAERDSSRPRDSTVSRPRGIPLGLKTLHSQGREGFLSASRLYSLKAERFRLVGLETIPSWQRGCTTSSTRRRESWPLRLYNLVDQILLVDEVVQPQRPGFPPPGRRGCTTSPPGGFPPGRRGCTASPARIPSSWSTSLYNLAARRECRRGCTTSPARRESSWSTRLYSLAGQDSLPAGEAVQPRQPGGFPPGWQWALSTL